MFTLYPGPLSVCVSLSPSSGGPVSVADKSGRPVSHGVTSGSGSSHQGQCQPEAGTRLSSGAAAA